MAIKGSIVRTKRFYASYKDYHGNIYVTDDGKVVKTFGVKEKWLLVDFGAKGKLKILDRNAIMIVL